MYTCLSSLLLVLLSFDAEGRALHAGLLLAIELDLPRVVFETDCSSLFKCIEYGYHHDNASLELLKSCRIRLLSLLGPWFVFVERRMQRQMVSHA